MDRAKHQLEEVTDLMNENIVKMEERGEKLHILEGRADDLEEKGRSFQVCFMTLFFSLNQ